MCAEVKRDFGAIDVLVNNVAINRDKTFKRLTKEAWDEVSNTDLTSVADQAMESVPAARRGCCTWRRRRRGSSPGWCSILTGASPCDDGPGTGADAGRSGHPTGPRRGRARHHG